jgi:two-component sensor histidine kinase
VSQAIASNIYTDEVLHLFVEMTARALGYKICTVMLVNPDSRELEIKATQSESQEYNRKPHLKLGESIAGRAALEGQVLVIPDVRKNSEYRFPDVARVAGLCSLCSVPLWSKGKVVGVLNCYTEKAHTFTKEEIAILQALAAQAALAIENAKLMVRSAVIQEMHHRVKNNLQQIASLVRLQQHFSNYITVGDALSDTLNRILAIAAVHELLSRDDLDTVSVNKVADQILSAAKQSVVAPGKTVYTEIAGPEVRLPLSQATSVALVINELVHNAIEHGFGDLDEGRIRIETDCTDREATIVVQNDGKPLPDGFDPAESNSLGLKIVTDLVRGGLGGSFQMENRDRITATVRFPLASAANRP